MTMKPFKTVFLFIFIATFIPFGLYGQLDEQTIEFEFGENLLQAHVNPTDTGSEIILKQDGKEKNISLQFPGENLFPTVTINPKGNRYTLAWKHYEPRNQQMCVYDSLTNTTKLLPLKNFSTAAPIQTIFLDDEPLLLLFLGSNSDNTDIFYYLLEQDVYVNITKSPDSEQAWKIEDEENRFFIETTTLHNHRRYRVKKTGLKITQTKEYPVQHRFHPHAASPNAYNTITGFGDSITWGTVRMDLNNRKDEYHPELAYLAQLQQMLADNYGLTTTINLGVPSETSFQASQRMPEELADMDSYFMIVFFGTNDVASGVFNADASIQNLEFIIESARTYYGFYPLCTTIPPQKNETKQAGVQYFKVETEVLNEKILDMVERINVPHIDTYKAFFDYGDWNELLEAYKGNHPSPLGHEMIAGMFMEKILALPPAPPTELVNTGGSALSQSVTWTQNSEFDFSHYNIEFGFSADDLSRSVTTENGQFDFILLPTQRDAFDTLYYRIQSVDKDGNTSEFSPVNSITFN